MFTSGKIHHDPKPYVLIRVAGEQGERVAEPPAGTLAEVFLDPRARFDHHNPVLVEFRTDAIVEPTYYEHICWWLATLDENTYEGWTPEQIDHAHRVLTKLSALAD